MQTNSYQYNKLHRWLRRTYGKANRCDHCNVIGHTRYEWALKKGFNYEFNINNFIPLCKKCHNKYDFTDERKMKISKTLTGKMSLKRKPILLVKGSKTISFPSITAAANYIDSVISGIGNVLYGKSKSCKGYIVEYLFSHAPETCEL